MSIGKQNSIRRSLIVFSLILLVDIALLGGVGLYNTNILSQKLNELANVHLQAVRTMTLADMMHDTIRSNAFHAIIVMETKDLEAEKEVQEEADEIDVKIMEHIATLKRLPLDPKVLSAISDSSEHLEAYIKIHKSLLELTRSRESTKAFALLPELQTKFKDLEGDLEKIGDAIEDNAKHFAEKSIASSHTAEFINLILAILGFLFGIAMSAFIIFKTQKGLTLVVESLDSEVEVIQAVANRLNNSTTILTESTSKQGNILQESAAAIEEMSAMVQKTSESTEALELSTISANQAAKDGQQAIGKLLDVIDLIDRSNNNIISQVEGDRKTIADIVNVISDIESKTNVINEIVFQTKLLSFNASVEAARAGENGKGFTVVAEEVGKLAEMSGKAAKEITDLLSQSTSRIQRIVVESSRKSSVLMDDCRVTLDLGKKVANQCDESLRVITKQTSSISMQTSEITKAVREQNIGLKEVSRSILVQEQLTQENIEVSHENASNSNDLLLGTEKLNNVIRELMRMADKKILAND